MIDYVRIQGSSFLPLFFLLADCWFNVSLLVNTHVPASDTSTNENAFVRRGQRSSSEYDSSLSASCGSCHPFQGLVDFSLADLGNRFWWVERLNPHFHGLNPMKITYFGPKKTSWNPIGSATPKSTCSFLNTKFHRVHRRPWWPCSITPSCHGHISMRKSWWKQMPKQLNESHLITIVGW